MHQYSADELIGKPAEFLVCPGESGSETGIPEIKDKQPVDSMSRRKDGSVFPILFTKTELKDESGNINCYSASIVDMSAYKRAEQRILHLNKVLLAIRNVNQLIVQEKDRKTLLEKVCYFLTESRGYTSAWAGATDEEGTIIYSAKSGQVEDLYDKITAIDLHSFPPHCIELCRKTPDEIIVLNPDDCDNCPMFEDKIPGRKMIKNLVHKEKSYGFLCVSIPETIETDETEFSLFAEVAGDIAYAFYNIETEEKRAEAETEALENEKKYRELFDKMLNGFAIHEIITDEHGKPIDYRFLDLNPAFESLTGLKKEEIVGKTVKEVLPNTEDYWIENYGNVALTGIPIHFENYSESLDKYYEVTAYSSRPGTFAVIFSNVTEQKKAQLELAKKHNLLERVLETSPIGINLIDRNGNIFYSNKGAEELTAVDPDTYISRQYDAFEWRITDTDGNLLPDEQIPHAIVKNTEKPIYNNVLCIHTPMGDRRTIQVNAAPIFDESGQFDGSIVLFNDITNELNNEKQLSRRNSELSAIFRAIPDLFLKIDEKGKITECLSSNDDIKKFGFPVTIADRYLWELIDALDEEQILTIISDSISSNETATIESSLLLRGETRSYEIRIIPVVENRLICIIRDITVTKKLQNQILAKNRELESFAQVVGHEMKNPINIIANYLISMEEEPEAFQEYSGKIIGICKNLNVFINNLLKLSRAGKIIGEKKTVDIDDIMKSAIASYTAMEKDVNINIVNGISERHQVPGDEDSMRQVINNIIENSINYRDPDKETLIIETGAARDDDKITVFIKDNGLGIQEVHERIFNPGATLKKHRGTGFGLAISKKIMEAHGGKIYAESRGKYQGTTIYLEFPINGGQNC
jgi:PAS domain S-box-containing protein